MHAPATTIKYVLAGALTNAALTAAEMGELGHRGDLQTLDDSEFGYPRFIGTMRWEPNTLTSGLGVEWRFPKYQMYKPYPHCRVMHAPLDLLIDLISKNDIKVDEIDSIKAFGEGWAYVLPSFVSRDIQRVEDAQFCFAHGTGGGSASHSNRAAKWQDPAVVFDPSVMEPDEQGQSGSSSGQRPGPRGEPVQSHVARGNQGTWPDLRRGKALYPKGTPSPDPESFMTTDELVLKFRSNADGIISAASIDSVVDGVLNLEKVCRFRGGHASTCQARVIVALAKLAARLWVISTNFWERDHGCVV